MKKILYAFLLTASFTEMSHAALSEQKQEKSNTQNTETLSEKDTHLVNDFAELLCNASFMGKSEKVSEIIEFVRQRANNADLCITTLCNARRMGAPSLYWAKFKSQCYIGANNNNEGYNNTIDILIKNGAKD
ncbi:MAG: hypothetical protein WCT20_00925 [Candidatus Babeliales bacterium]